MLRITVMAPLSRQRRSRRKSVESPAGATTDDARAPPPIRPPPDRILDPRRVGEAIAASEPPTSRKVRTPQDRVVGNTNPGRPAGQCHREQTARPPGASRAGRVRVKR